MGRWAVDQIGAPNRFWDGEDKAPSRIRGECILEGVVSDRGRKGQRALGPFNPVRLCVHREFAAIRRPPLLHPFPNGQQRVRGAIERGVVQAAARRCFGGERVDFQVDVLDPLLAASADVGAPLLRRLDRPGMVGCRLATFMTDTVNNVLAWGIRENSVDLSTLGDTFPIGTPDG
jgi:hypothetical protein